MIKEELKKLTNSVIHKEANKWIENYPDKFVVYYKEKYNFMVNVKFTIPWRLRIKYGFYDFTRKYIYLGIREGWLLCSSHDRKKILWEFNENINIILEYYSDMHRIWE